MSADDRTAPDIHAQIDRQVSAQGISHEDAATIHNFADFLKDPSSRCPICLDDGHIKVSECPEGPTDAELVAILGLVLTREERMRRADAGYAARVATLGARSRG